MTCVFAGIWLEMARFISPTPTMRPASWPSNGLFGPSTAPFSATDLSW